MTQLPTNRTTANTPQEHVDDHNTLHAQHDVWEPYSPDDDANFSSNSATHIPTQRAVKAYFDTNLPPSVLSYRGATNCSTNPNYPAAVKGDAYVVTVAGKIGGAAGTAVSAGDVYFATADNAGGTQAAVGSSWALLPHNLVGALLSANNLSDLASAASARTNLGLGTAATHATTDFAQTANNLSDVTATTARSNLGLGSAATQNTSAFLQPANNLSDVSAAATARTNLGLGTAATHATGDFLQTANNLSDVTAATARTNIGAQSQIITNVKDYAAAGNGTTDDTTAIQNAINAAGVAGGIVFFPAGTYKITSSLSWPHNVRLDGAIGGAGASNTYPRILWGGATHGTMITVATVGSTAPTANMEHLRIDGNSSADHLITAAERLDWDFGFRCCQFINSLGDGIVLTNGSVNTYMRDFRFDNIGGYAVKTFPQEDVFSMTEFTWDTGGAGTAKGLIYADCGAATGNQINLGISNARLECNATLPSPKYIIRVDISNLGDPVAQAWISLFNVDVEVISAETGAVVCGQGSGTPLNHWSVVGTNVRFSQGTGGNTAALIGGGIAGGPPAGKDFPFFVYAPFATGGGATNSPQYRQRIWLGGETVHQATRTDAAPLQVTAITSQTANLQEWQNSSGTALASVSAAGVISAPNIVSHSIAPTLIGSAGINSSGNTQCYTSSTDLTEPVAAGDTVIIASGWIQDGASATPTVSDTQSNTWHVIAQADRTTAGSSAHSILAWANITTPLAVTDRILVSYGTSVDYPTTATLHALNLATSPVDQTATGTGSSTSPATSAITTAKPFELFVSYAFYRGNPSFTAQSGWSNPDNTTNGTTSKASTQYLANQGGQTFTPSGTLGTSGGWAMSAATFKVPGT